MALITGTHAYHLHTILSRAKRIIENYDARYICDAVSWAVKGYPELAGAAGDVKLYIGQNLGYCAVLESYLKDEIGWPWGEKTLHPSTMRQCRLAWIERMMYQLDKTGSLP